LATQLLHTLVGLARTITTCEMLLQTPILPLVDSLLFRPREEPLPSMLRLTAGAWPTVGVWRTALEVRPNHMSWLPCQYADSEPTPLFLAR